MSSEKPEEPAFRSGRLISGGYDNSTKPCAVQAILESLMASNGRRSDGAHQHTFLSSNTQHSTFHHQPKAGGPPFSPEREIFRKLSYTPTYNYEQSS